MKNLLTYVIIPVIFVLLSCKSVNTLIPEELDKPILDPSEIAHSEIWRRFIDEYGCVVDYTDLDGTKNIPTSDECRDSKPNGLGWWTPIENGPMFGGIYMDGIINRWESTQLKEDEIKVRRIAKGLLLLGSISDVEGFVARGVTHDGSSHYPLGSNDQTAGWFYGLWRYLETDLPSLEERKLIEENMLKTANAIVRLKWVIPAEPPFNFRGSFATFNHNAARLLFVAKSMYFITMDEYWNQLYITSLNQKGGVTNETRMDIVAKGLEYTVGKTSTWDQSLSVACMRELWELETDPVIKEAYRKGLENSANAALKSFPMAETYLPDDPEPYELDWRQMNVFWQPQTTSAQAEVVARKQIDDLNARKGKFLRDVATIREPCFAAWVVSLAPDSTLLKERKPEIERILNKYEYSKIYEVWFFPIIAAWYRVNAN